MSKAKPVAKRSRRKTVPMTHANMKREALLMLDMARAEVESGVSTNLLIITADDNGWSSYGAIETPTVSGAGVNGIVRSALAFLVEAGSDQMSQNRWASRQQWGPDPEWTVPVEVQKAIAKINAERSRRRPRKVAQ